MSERDRERICSYLRESWDVCVGFYCKVCKGEKESSEYVSE